MRAAILVVLVACGGGSGGPLGTCADLTLAECRTTEGCAADICATCFCDLAYRGCLPEFETPAECPQLGCPGALCCSTADQCNGQGECTKPGTPPGCGPCSTDPGDCIGDSECSGGQICEPIACSCNGLSHCVAGCNSPDGILCGDGRKCDLESGRCVVRTCADDTECFADFACVDGECTRKQCADDLDCDGFCVLGECFTGERGECRIPPV